MKKSMKQALLATILFLFLLAACAPAPVETPDPQEIENQIATSVALTVASQNLDTAEAAPPATETPLPLPTATLPPLDTPTAVPPLDTPTALPLPTTASSGGSSGGSTGNQAFSCEAINRRPYDNTVFKPNDKFDIKWTIVNDGTQTLKAGLDLKFSNGDKLMPDKVVELPELKPGAEFQVNFDGTAPASAGSYVMVYVVEGGVCYPYTAIIVEK